MLHMYGIYGAECYVFKNLLHKHTTTGSSSASNGLSGLDAGEFDYSMDRSYRIHTV